MDRKAWIIISICAAFIGFQVWWGMTHPQVQQATTAPAATEAASKNTPATSPGAPTAAAGAPGAATPATPAPEQKVTLKNSEVAYTFTSRGGGIATAELLDTKDHVELNSLGKAAVGSLNSGAKSWDDITYHVVSQTDSGITFEGETPQHLLVRKEYRFTEGKGSNPHLLNYKITFLNKSGARLSRGELYLYTGAAASLRPDEILKPSFCWNDAGDATSKDTNYFGSHWFGGTVNELTQSAEKLRWAGVMSRFYAQLVSTKEDQPAKLWAEPFPVDHSNDEFKNDASGKKDLGVEGAMILPALDMDNGESKSFDLRIYMGPKVFRDLARIDDVDPDRQFRYVMFYGWFTKVSQFLVWLMRVFHDMVSNWGVAIILLTLTVRSVLWPIQAKANSSMKRMSLVSPMMKEVQEKYKDDPQRINAEMIKLYREYGINPVGGCLPMFVQIPIFLGFYRALQYAAELRGQDFLWVHDLSMPDTVAHFMGFPVNPLPLVMGLSSFLQMRLTPQPPNADKTQAMMLRFMPLIFLFFCYNFAAALALYWTTQNIFSIFQAQIQRRFQKDIVLEKKRVVSDKPRPSFFDQRPGAPPAKEKKKSSLPRLGGGGSRSTRKNP
jgi:YidC/Oxa1 family membrane protein insertase